jgi:hypothetical protein
LLGIVADQSEKAMKIDKDGIIILDDDTKN